MPSTSVCWGIEIGASAIKALKLEATGEGGVKALEYALIQHPKPLSTPGVDANDVLRVSLGAFASQYDLSKASVAVSVPGHSGFARFAKLPPVERKKVPDIVKFEAMQQIPFPLEQVEWDYQTFISPDSPEVEVGIFAITKERVAERLAMLADFGINPNHVVLSPIAAYNALAYDLAFDAKTPGTIIVDVGTTSTDLVVATPGRVWVRTFPIGGHQFTEAMVQQFQLSYPKAEKLKREAEDSKHARQVFQAMRPVFTDMAADIQRSIGYYQSLNKDAVLTRLIGIGSTFHLPGLRKYLKQQLALDVYRIEQFKRLNLEGTREGDDKSKVFQDASLNLCTAYGLALQGLGLNAVGGNLMPVSLLRKSVWKEKVPWFGMAAGVATAAAAAMFIGPVKDYFDVSGKAPDAVIRTATDRAAKLKNEANEAGVTNAGEPQLDAANSVALIDKRGTMARITLDVQEMLAAAESAKAGWAQTMGAPDAANRPALTLESLLTTYQAPVAESTDPYAASAAGEDDASGRLKISQYPRVKCEMTLSSFQPETRRFVAENLQRWMAKHSKREGVAYTIHFDEPAFRVQEVKVAATEAVTRPGDEAAAPGGKGLRSGPRDQRVEERPLARGRLVGGGPETAAMLAAQSQSAAAEELEKLAPLIEDAAGRPQKTATVTVTWWATFIPAQPAGEGGGL